MRLVSGREQTPRCCVLWGDQHIEPGKIEVCSLGSGVALAISKGGAQKEYPHTDPNEDVVAAAIGERGTLLMCADGHNGFEASREAVTSVLEQVGDDPSPEDFDDASLVSLFYEAGEAVQRCTGAAGCRNRHSRATLTIAFLAPPALQWASMGDSSLFIVSDDDCRLLGKHESLYVGWPMAPDHVSESLRRGRENLPPRSWIVVATDGLTEFVGYEASVEALRELVQEVAPAPGLAREIVKLAFDAGAGDNVAVAVAAAGELC